MYSLYSLVFLVALSLSTPWWLLQMLRHGKYRTGWSERLGKVPDRLFNRPAENTIWIHAVSVGEVLAVTRVVEELQAALPGWRIVVSTTTDTGQALARQRFGESNVFYLPLDLSTAVRPYFRALRPCCWSWRKASSGRTFCTVLIRRGRRSRSSTRAYQIARFPDIFAFESCCVR